MAKIRDINQALETYGGSGGDWSYFTLENDRDTEVVRFLLEDRLIAEEDWFVVHEIEVGGQRKFVQCTEEADCPCCVGGSQNFIKLYLQLVTKSDGQRKIWERGKTFVPKINELITKHGDLCSRPYEVERQGAKNSRRVNYEFFPLERDDRTLEELGIERVKILDGHNGPVLQLTYEEMQDAMDGKFRLNNNKGNDRGRDDRGSDRRSGARDDRSSDRGGRDRGREDRGREEAPPRRRERGNTEVF